MMSYKTLLAFIFTILISSFDSPLLAQEENTVIELEKQLMAHPMEDTTRVDIIIKMCKYYNSINQNKEAATKYADEAYRIAKELNDPKRLFLVLESLSSLAFDNQKVSQALKILKEQLDLARKHNMTKAELMALTNMGHAYFEIGADGKAEEYYSEAHEVSKKLNSVYSLIFTINNLANLQSSIGNHKSAIDKLLKSISYKEKLEPKYMLVVAETYTFLANAYSGLNELDKAKDAFDSCQATISRYKLSKHTQQVLYYELGRFYLNKLNTPHNAIVSLQKILTDSVSAIKQGGILEVYNLLASAYLKDNNPTDAFKYAMRSKSMLDSLDDVELGSIRTTYQCLASSKAKLNDWRSAYDYRTIADNLADSISQKKESELATFAIIGREIESNERELIEKNNRTEQQKRVYETIGFLAIPILIILATLFYYINRLTRSKERISMQLSYSETLEKKIEERTQELEEAHKIIDQAKERENMSLALLNHRHMSLLSSLSEKLESWEEVNANIGIKDIRSVLHDIKAAQSETEEWGSFMLHFERIHPDFVQKLISICPSLSNNELKHCAYMKLGLARKYVAEIQRSTEDAVKLARNRIRKKLDFDADMSLQEFINML